MNKFSPPSKETSTLSRRAFLRKIGGIGAASAGALAMPAIWTTAKSQPRRIVMRDPGGPYRKGFGEAFYKPFTAATGIEVVPVVAQADPTTMIKGMVETKSHAWDMALLNVQSQEVLVNPENGIYLEKVEVNAPEIPAQYKTEYMIGTNVVQTVLAVRTDKFKGRLLPNSWADFWDAEGFPGRRALRRAPADTLEESWLAAMRGNEPVYPINEDKAFENLSRIRSDVQVWWTGGAQTSRMLKTHEVDMLGTWNARAQVAVDEGAPVKIIWNQGLWSPEGFCILKGTPNASLCREFIKFICDAKRQAVYTKYLTYGPTNPDAYKFIDPTRAKVLPTYPDNIANAVQISGKYWARNKVRLTERFNQWLLT